MRHQALTEVVSLVNQFLGMMTNQAYARNFKFGYRVTWTKGTKRVTREDGKYITDYYIFRFYMIDKTESLAGKEVELYVNFYPKVNLQSVERLEELAYKEFLQNGIVALANLTYRTLEENRNKEYVQPSDVEINQVVEDLKEQAKTPKIII